MYQHIPSTASASFRRNVLESDIVKSKQMRGRWCRPAEVFKLLMVFSTGFTLHFLWDFHLRPPCEKCSPCVILTEAPDLLKPDPQPQLREKYKPKSVDDVIRYDYFNSSHILNNFDGSPIKSLLGYQKSDFKDILHQTMALLNSAKQRPWKLKKLLNGYRHFDPLRGEEFVFDVEMHSADAVGGKNQIEEVFF